MNLKLNFYKCLDSFMFKRLKTSSSLPDPTYPSFLPSFRRRTWVNFMHLLLPCTYDGCVHGTHTCDVRKVLGFLDPLPLVAYKIKQPPFIVSVFWVPPPTLDVICVCCLRKISPECPRCRTIKAERKRRDSGGKDSESSPQVFPHFAARPFYPE